MAVYNKQGQPLSIVYGKNGLPLSAVYNKSGNKIFPDAPTTIKVMTYNVGQWYLGNHDNVPANLDQAYYDLQNGMIARNNPDILLLEEYTKQFSKTGRTAISMLSQYFPYIHEQGGDNPTSSIGNGRCICSKYPITNYVVGNFNDGSGLYADRCEITVGDMVINVFVTHLNWGTGDDNDRKRQQEIATIISTAQGMENVIVGGDFNNTFWGNDTEARRETKYNMYVKPFIDAGFETANYGEWGYLVTCIDGTEESGPENIYLLDDIFVRGNMTIENAYVDTTKMTDSIVEKIDHMPLIAVLET